MTPKSNGIPARIPTTSSENSKGSPLVRPVGNALPRRIPTVDRRLSTDTYRGRERRGVGE